MTRLEDNPQSFALFSASRVNIFNSMIDIIGMGEKDDSPAQLRFRERPASPDS